MICNAKDLSPDQKVVIESLLGRRVQEDEAISVRAIQPPALSDQRRQELVEKLRKYFAEVDALRKPASAEEAEEILTEAIRSTRPGYRPRQ
jgi:sugar-specific transcriptional regulator TrmB